MTGTPIPKIAARILCPAHEDKRTPNFVIYTNGWGYCYQCGYRKFYAGFKELSHSVGFKEEESEDVFKSLAYILDLPKELIRGLFLHHDDVFFYIVWPNAAYYKKRYLNPREGQPKYLCPRGHRKPLFIPITKPTRDTLLIVEGELNALSLAEAFPDYHICSPGGTGDLYSRVKSNEYLAHYTRFDTIYVMVDDDNAGRAAGMGLTAQLLPHKKNVRLVCLEKDANSLLESDGKEGLREKVTPRLEMQVWV